MALNRDVRIAAFAGAVDYIPVVKTARVVGGRAVLTTTSATAVKTITLQQGSTNIGVLTFPALDSAAGVECALVLDPTTLGKVEVGPSKPIKLTYGGAGNGAATLELELSPYHAG